MRALLVALLIAGAAHAPLGAQSWRTVTTSRRLGGENALDVSVRFGAGTFRVHPAPEGLLFRSRLRYDEDVFRPHYDFDGRSLRIGVDGTRGARIARGSGGGEMELELSDAVPIDLEVEFGAARADIDLGGLSLADLTVRTGASESVLEVSRPNPVTLERARFEVGAADFTARGLGNLNARTIEVSAGVGDLTLDLSGEWREDARVQVAMGLGALELRLPAGVGIKLERETLLTKLDTDGLVKRGDAWYSRDWDRARRRVTIRVEAAFGHVGVIEAR